MSKITSQVSIVVILVALCLVTAQAEDGVYILDRAQGLHRLGNTPASNLDTLSPSSVDFEVSEDGLEIFALEPEGMIRSNKAGAPVLGKALQQSTARRMAISRQGYVVLDNQGTIHFSEGQPDPGWNAYFGWDIARDVELTREGDGMVVLDGFGSLHIRGNSPTVQTPFFGWDIARDVEYSPEEDGYYILDGFGNIHSIGDIPPLQGENLGWDIARDLELTQTGEGFYILDGFGGLHVGGDALPFAVPYFGWDVATDMEISPQPRGRLTGSVFAVNSDGTQTPLRRAVVVLQRIDIPEDTIRDLPGHGAQQGIGALQTRSKNDGSYQFPPLPAGRYSVTVSAGGFGALTAEVDILSGEEITRDFVLTSGSVPPPPEYGPVEGTVAEDTGNLTLYIPVPNARVKLWLSNTQVLVTRTNEDGQFSFEQVPAGRYPIRAEAEGFYPEDERIEVNPGQTAGIAFQLEERPVTEPGRVYGTVWTASGEDLYMEPADNAPLARMPVEGALVKIIPVDGPGFRDPFNGENFIPRADQNGQETRTNEEGFYEFNDVAPGSYVLLVESEGFKPERRWFRLGDCSESCNEKEINVRLFPVLNDFGLIRGNVSGLDPDVTGEVIPLEGALVHAVPVPSVTPTLANEWHPSRFVARTNENGDYSFERLPAGNYQLIVTARGYLAERRQVYLAAGNELGENFLLEPIVHQTGAIAGYVFSASCPLVEPADPSVEEITSTNCPIEGAVVMLLPKPRPVGPSDGANPVSDEVLNEIPFMPELISDLEINRRFRSVTTAADGSYSFENVPVGHYQLVARARGFLPGHEEADVFADETTELDFLLRPAPPPRFGGLVGSVTDTLEGTPVEDAVVTAWPLHLEQMVPPEAGANAFDNPEDHPWAPRPFRTRTDDEGNYEFERLPVGPYRITVRARGYEPARGRIFIENAVAKVLDFGLEPGPVPGSVIGRVMTGEADASIPPRPVEGATVKLIPLDIVVAEDVEQGRRNDAADPAGQIFRTRTDNEGRYEFPSIPAGAYLLMVHKHNFVSQRRRTEVPSGGTVEENFFLQPAGSPATGTVLVSVLGPTEDPATDGIIPVTGAWVFLSRWINQPGNGVSCAGCFEEGYFARTDENGRCQFENVRPGAYKLLVRANGFKPDFRKIIVRPEEVIHAEFLLEREGNGEEPDNGSLSGTVSVPDSAGTISPLSDVTVKLFGINIRLGLETKTNNAGEYEFPRVPAGPFKVVIHEEGYVPFEHLIEIVEGEETVLDIVLDPQQTQPGTAAIHGKVLTLPPGTTPGDNINFEDLVPLPGATVYLGRDFGVVDGAADGQTNPNEPVPDLSRAFKITHTDSEGRFVFDQLDSGRWVVIADKEGFHWDADVAFLDEGEVARMTIVIIPLPSEEPSAGRVKGIVTAPGERGNRRVPVAGAHVMISSPSIPTFAPVETETDRFGHFTIGQIPAAPDYHVVIEAEGLQSYHQDFVVEPGQITFLTCEMQPAGANERPPEETAALTD